MLSNGENVQPQSLEDAICTSPYITFAVLVSNGRWMALCWARGTEN